MRKIYFFFLLFIIVIFLLFVWLGSFFLPREFGQSQTKSFAIEEGTGAQIIAANLKREGLIRSALAFRIYTVIRGKSSQLKAGTYELSPSMTINEIAARLVEGRILQFEVTLPEGLTVKEMEEKINSNLLPTGQAGPPTDKAGKSSTYRPGRQDSKLDLVSQKTSTYQNDYSFLGDAPADSGLEGFLFPDTYKFGLPLTAEKVVRKMLDNFSGKLTLDLKAEIQRQNKTVFEIVTMASLIEKEVRTPEDKKIVSGILWKRISIGMPLQVDATISYITGKKTTQLSFEETRLDNSYNTYMHKGLPPGSISNPGLESIIAAIYPQPSEYLFYLSARDGRTIFSRTLPEHNIAKAKYL